MYSDGLHTFFFAVVTYHKSRCLLRRQSLSGVAKAGNRPRPIRSNMMAGFEEDGELFLELYARLEVNSDLSHRLPGRSAKGSPFSRAHRISSA